MGNKGGAWLRKKNGWTPGSICWANTKTKDEIVRTGLMMNRKHRGSQNAGAEFRWPLAGDYSDTTVRT